jgi:ferrous iron transport protein B
MPDLTLALAGNPNAGKSTIFNALTGLRQHVGNWPGKTVERREGICQHKGVTINVIDLPGAYSLAAYSPEEIVARNFLLNEPPDAIVNVIDATNLERNLYLTVQLLELGIPVIIALNMADSLRKENVEIDLRELSRSLGNAPVVLTAANRNEGLSELLTQVVAATRRRQKELAA